MRGFSFDVNSGTVELLELDSFGISIIPSSLVGILIFCLFDRIVQFLILYFVFLILFFNLLSILYSHQYWSTTDICPRISLILSSKGPSSSKVLFFLISGEYLCFTYWGCPWSFIRHGYCAWSSSLTDTKVDKGTFWQKQSCWLSILDWLNSFIWLLKYLICHESTSFNIILSRWTFMG